MKKQILSAAMALSMLAMQLPMTSFAQESTMTEEDLIAALEQAQDGATVELTGSVELTGQLVIEKPIVLDGNGYTISKGESEDVFPNNAGILVTAGATIRDLTVEGPNTNPEGWDSGEFGIKLYEAQGAQLQNVTVEQGNAGIQVSGGSVIMTGTIDVSNNEFGGIELCREGRLDLTQAALVNGSETGELPTLWSDSGKGTILASESQPLYIWREYDTGKDHIYLDQANLGVEAEADGTAYETLAQALEAAGVSEGDKTVTLLKDVSLDSGDQAESRASGAVLTLPAGVTLDGRGHSVAYAGETEVDSLLYISRETLEQIGTIGSTEDVTEILEQVRTSIQGSDRVELNYDEESGSVSVPAPIRHAITLDAGENGALTADRAQAQSGTVVTLTITPDEGYRLEKLEALDSADQAVELTRQENGTYTFEMPESAVTVTASFVRNGAENSFQDVAEDDWFFEAVEYVSGKGIMSGVGDGRFAPHTVLSRAMLAQILYALEGKPEVDDEKRFDDVEAGDWYAGAVAWAAENGLVSGVGDDQFAPHDALTREQMALILYRYAQYKSRDVQVDGEPLEAFLDGDAISSWAVEAMAWAVDAGLLSGTGDNLLSPTGTATRAEVAQVLANFCQTIL